MTSDEPPAYRPIDCGLYSRLEVAILHRTPIACVWRDTGGERHEATLVPLDLTTRDRAEYLTAEDPTGRVEIRLDRLHVPGLEPDACGAPSPEDPTAPPGGRS